jgi:hypothetical protein
VCSARGLAPALLNIGSMSPPGYPSAWLRPRSARFCFARQDHCSSATTCRFSTSGLSVNLHRRSKFPVCAVEKRAACENLNVSEADTHQHKDEIERGSPLPVLHVPPFRQVGTGGQHRGLKGEKRNEKASVAPKKAWNLRSHGRACELEGREIRTPSR